jgi:4-azaleucine resistance transporter AzlC
MIQAFRYSFPVLLGYIAIGIAFGLMMAEAGYSWYLTLIMSVVMYAGAGQYAAVGFFAAGLGVLEVMLLQFVINARHIAYGITMLRRFNDVGALGGFRWKLAKWYLVFALTDETFALLSSLPEDQSRGKNGARLMLRVSLLDHSYWITGSLIGFFAGALIPFDFSGVDFALCALFIVLLVEQIFRVKRAGIFIASACLAVLAVIFLPERAALIGALAASLVLAGFFK